MNLVKHLTALLVSGITVVSAMDGADGNDGKKPSGSNLSAVFGVFSEHFEAYNRLAGNCRELSIKIKSLNDEYTSAFEKVKKMETHLDSLESRLKELDEAKASLLTEQLKIFSKIAEVNESVRRFKEETIPLLLAGVSSGKISGIDSSFFDLGRDPTNEDFQNLFAVLKPIKDSVTDLTSKRVLNEYSTMAQRMFLVAHEDEKCKNDLSNIDAEYTPKHSLYKTMYRRYEEEIAALEALRQKGVEASALYQAAKGDLDAFVREQEEKYR